MMSRVLRQIPTKPFHAHKMVFVSPAKQEELRLALEKIKSTVLIIYGPPGSSKTYTTEMLARFMGLSIQYMDEINLCKDSLVLNDMVCMIDIDDHGLFMKHKNKLEKMKNLIIETRTLPFIGRSLPNSITVNFNKVTSYRIRKFHKIDGERLKRIDGNLHAIGFYRYSVRNETMSIYHQLGKIFYSKAKEVEEIVRRADVYGLNRFIGYLDENCVFFMNIKDIARMLDGFSLCNISNEGFLEYSVDTLIRAEKGSANGFFCFRSFRGFDGGHVCGEVCRNR